MTFQTVCFRKDKEKGSVRKTGLKASFFDGNRRHERTLYYNNADGEWYVILDGEAFIFRWFTNQSERDCIIGFI